MKNIIKHVNPTYFWKVIQNILSNIIVWKIESLLIYIKADQFGMCFLVLAAGIDKLSITWKVSSTATKEPEFKTIKVKLCYAPISQVDRPWRKTENELFKDKSCPHKISSFSYDPTVKTAQSFDYTLERDIPTGTYYVRAYAVDAKDHEVAFGQSTNQDKTTNLFSVQAISGRHKSLDIASVCFSVFSVVALLVFFVNEKRKAKIEQSKWATLA